MNRLFKVTAKGKTAAVSAETNVCYFDRVLLWQLSASLRGDGVILDEPSSVSTGSSATDRQSGSNSLCLMRLRSPPGEYFGSQCGWPSSIQLLLGARHRPTGSIMLMFQSMTSSRPVRTLHAMVSVASTGCAIKGTHNPSSGPTLKCRLHGLNAVISYW